MALSDWALRWRTGGMGLSWRFGVLKELLKRETLTSVNQCSRLLLLVFLGSRSPQWGLEIERLQGLMKMRNLLNLFGSDKKELRKPLKVMDFWRRAWGPFIRSLSRISLLISAERDFHLFPLRCLLRLFLQKNAVDLVSRSWLLVVQEQEKTTTLAFLAQFLAGGSRVHLVDGRTKLQALRLASKVSDVTLFNSSNGA